MDVSLDRIGKLSTATAPSDRADTSSRTVCQYAGEPWG